ncbi:MAG: urea ABC transporter ATP-binding protein UrtD [Brevinematales bacterium]|nr:urea ABC transporter ATP-binding protein UrtD [Brevinematales bacterium]
MFYDDIILIVEDLTVDFNGFKALKNVNLYVYKKELRFLIGPNGAGKTTLLDVICGKVKPINGKVLFRKNINILSIPPYKICRTGISRKFQTPSIFGNLTVYENLELSLPENRDVFSTLFYKLKKESKEKIDETLEIIQLSPKKFELAKNLSHGEKQWLEIGMTIIQEPYLLLVDEPVAGMTGKERDKTGLILQKIAEKCSVVVVEHDMNFVEMFSKTVTVLHDGQILCEGIFEKIKNDPYVIQVYLGRGGGKFNA